MRFTLDMLMHGIVSPALTDLKPCAVASPNLDQVENSAEVGLEQEGLGLQVESQHCGLISEHLCRCVERRGLSSNS